jgi:DNA polymerase I-like protein with 3'-5' exonuclease and polymerase domains
VAQAREAQRRYFEAFPEIRDWQRHMAGLVKEQMPLVGPLGRVATLFGRPWDDHTRKQGLAFPPQGGVGDILNLGLYRLWKDHDPDLVQLLAQVHDAILGQYPLGRREDALRAITEAMRIETPVVDFLGTTRTCVIPVEVAVGGNWGKRSAANPRGLEEVKYATHSSS